MRKLALVLVLILLGGGMVYYTTRRVPNPDPNHTHADFAVWILGEQLDFAQEKYMSSAPIVETSLFPMAHAHEVEDHPLLPGREYLHLHDGNGYVLHRHKTGLGFGDFLASLDFELIATCLTTDIGQKICNESEQTWRFFVNGTEQTPFPVNFVFEDLDQILLTYGADDTEIQREFLALTDDACKYSQTCPGRGAPPTENCLADPAVPCVE